MWDYAEQKFNLGGYICLGFTVIWGTVAALSIKYLNPLLLLSDSAGDTALKTVFCIALSAFMIADIFSFVKTR